MRRPGLIFAVLFTAACGGTDPAGTELGESNSALVSPDVLPNGRATGVANQWAGPKGEGKPSGGGSSRGAGISYHGGPLITTPVNVYYIWYGNWASNTATTILSDFAQNVAPSPYFAINTLYTDSSLTSVTNAAVLAGVVNDAYSKGTTIGDADVQAIVAAQIAAGPTAGGLPADANGVYFVLTSADVAESSGFCTQYCGWHTHSTIAGTDVKFAFVGNPERCPSACMASTNRAASPNGNLGADGMASIIGHELEEAVTDPDLNAWYDNRGYENADKCAWTFGTTYAAAGGGQANMKLGARDFLVQRNWVPLNGGYCAVSYP
jgi:hypothetical protein